MSSRFVFVDRDGTLIEDRGYTHKVEDYAPLAGAVEGLRQLSDAGFRVAIVTNQSGIGRGYYGEADFERFQAHLVRDLAARGVEIEASYHCPHRPDAGCACRKPAIGLLERAQRELGADLAASWVIGDSPADVALALRAGCGAVYVLTGQGAALRGELPADVPVADDLPAAARYILSAASSIRSERARG